ncbi:hypothetical protein ABPG75_007049 [Micractinium tetrahymenae]
MRPKEAADLRALLAQEQERRRDAERRLAAHAARASENNTALARNNLRLQEQLARLRGEADALAHEAGCQRAAAAARDRLAAEELGRLRARLQRAEAEQQLLRKQLAAKQGIISYLESKVEQLQSRNKQPSLDAGALAAAAAECMKVGAAGAAAGTGDDEAAAVSDSSSRGSLTVGDWAAAAAELEAQAPPCPASAAVVGECSDHGNMWVSARGSEGSSEGSEDGEGLGQDPPAAAPAAQHLNGMARAGRAAAQVVTPAGIAQEEPAAEATVTEDAVAGNASAPAAGAAAAGPAAVTAAAAAPAPAAAAAAAIAAAIAVAEEVTPVRRPSGQAAEPSLEPAGTVLRSSLRPRSSGVSYAEPSLRSKLRQGDAHTFGSVDAATARANGSSRLRARTKPRPLFAAGGKAGPGAALQPVVD